MFEKLLNVEKTVNQPCVQHKHTNNRHRYSISVQDRIFKIKKNQNYIKKKKEKEMFDQKQASMVESKLGVNEAMVAEAQEIVQNELIKQEELKNGKTNLPEN